MKSHILKEEYDMSINWNSLEADCWSKGFNFHQYQGQGGELSQEELEIFYEKLDCLMFKDSEQNQGDSSLPEIKWQKA